MFFHYVHFSIQPIQVHLLGAFKQKEIISNIHFPSFQYCYGNLVETIKRHRNHPFLLQNILDIFKHVIKQTIYRLMT